MKDDCGGDWSSRRRTLPAVDWSVNGGDYYSKKLGATTTKWSPLNWKASL